MSPVSVSRCSAARISRAMISCSRTRSPPPPSPPRGRAKRLGPAPVVGGADLHQVGDAGLDLDRIAGLPRKSVAPARSA